MTTFPITQENPFYYDPFSNYDEASDESQGVNTYGYKYEWPTLDEFVGLLKECEANTDEGYDQRTKRWMPVDSPEGGSKTVGYGFKLQDKPEYGKISYQEAKNGITEAFHRKKLQEAYNLAKMKVQKYLGNNQLNNVLSPMRLALMDLSHQVNLQSFQKLRQAISDGDMDGIKREFMTYITKKDAAGNVISKTPLTRRFNLRSKYFIIPTRRY